MLPSPIVRPVPEKLDSAARLAAVEELRLPGHAGDPHLDAAVRALAVACRVPIAVVNLATPGRQTYPAEVGVGQPCTTVPDELSFCVEVVEDARLLHVRDATEHPRYAANPLVLAGHVRAYAGHPLMHEGHVVGSLSLFDSRPRRFDDGELEVLALQARLVEAVLSLRRAAAWDSLTGVAGRPLLLDRLERALARQPLVGLALLDVCGMGELNLRHGSAAGDRALVEIADRLSQALGHRDSVARTGPDEFAVVLEDLTSVEQARTRAVELVDVASGPLLVDGLALPLVLSCGVATSPAGSPEALLAAAESALGRLSGHVAGQRPAVASAAAAGELRAALARGELVVHYQPIVDLTTSEVRGVEALVRWQHPERGLLPPSEFIADAEDSGLILAIGARVLRIAAEQAARWHRAGRDLTVSVNLSPKQMAVASFERTVAETLAATGAPPELLMLEITESSVMDEPSAPGTLARLRALGVRLALDDFGTGYSSLSYLRRFAVDTIKIDRSFVAGLGRNADDDAIVASVVSLAARVDKAVVAEGVETREQADALRRLGVPLAQGFLWSRALPVDELEAWMAAHRAVPVPTPRPAAPPEPPTAAEAGSAEQTIWQMHTAGASLHTIAAALNAEGSRSPRGVRWHTRTVAAVIAAGAVT